MTTERLIEILLDDSLPSYTKDQDNEVVAISLLRDKIPYEACKSILRSAGYEVLYLCSPDKAAPYLTEEDAFTLSDCGVNYDEDLDVLYKHV